MHAARLAGKRLLQKRFGPAALRDAAARLLRAHPVLRAEAVLVAMPLAVLAGVAALTLAISLPFFALAAIF